MVPPQVSHRTAMPQMEEIPYKNEECGTFNPSFSFPDTSDVYPTPNIPISQEPTPPRAAAFSDTHLIPVEKVCSPVIINNKTSSPTKTSSSSPMVPQALEELSPVSLTQTHDSAPPRENPGSLCEMTPDACELQSDASFGPSASDKTGVAPLTDPDLGTISFDNADESLLSPFSPFSTACSQMASEETEEPVLKAYVKTPPYSPLPPSPLPYTTGTPPPTPDQGPLKATLVHIDTSPTDSPPETPTQRAETLNAEANQPSTCLDHSDPSESEAGTGDGESPPQDSGPLAESGTNQDSSRVGEENSCLGDEEADKNSEGELDSDEEELLRIIALCNPVLITFRK